DAKAEELMTTPGHIKDFLDKLKDDKKLLEKAEAAAASGHGGGLDKLLTQYLRDLPAGQLNNDPSIERYMPTVKERIESLQKQAKNTMKKNDHPYAETAEIVTLRNMIKAERKVKSSLDFKIPTDGRDLAAEVEKLKERNSFQSLVVDKNVKAQITSGHGGQMMTEMRKAFKSFDKNIVMNNDPATENSLKEGTINGRLMQIRDEAASLKEKLNTIVSENKNGTRDYDDVLDMFKQCKALIAEDIALSQYCDKKKPDGDEPVPWRKIRSMQKEILNDAYVETALYSGDLTRDQAIATRLDQLSQKIEPTGFYKAVSSDVKNVMKGIEPQHDIVDQAQFDKLSNKMEKVFNDINNKPNNADKTNQNGTEKKESSKGMKFG
ncbi:MAG: hypothetical protein J5842_06030, partial [Lachnospiraceae bacterium]|nr:hypothetical protein [Lachnospiraceae bacterium]